MLILKIDTNTTISWIHISWKLNISSYFITLSWCNILNCGHHHFCQQEHAKKIIWWVVRQYAMHVFLTQSTSDSNNYLQRRCHCCLLNIMAVIFINMYDETSKVTTFIQQLLETLDLRLFRSIISIWTTTCAARL